MNGAMGRATLVCAWLLMASCNLKAASLDGGLPAAFLQLGVGPRAIGMGGAGVAVAEDPFAMYYNPAGMGQSKDWQAAAQLGFLPYGRVSNFFATILPFSETPYTLGFAWDQFSFGDPVEVRSKNSATPDSTFYASDNGFYISFSSWLLPATLSLGGSLKLFQSSLGDGSAFGGGEDLSLLYFPTPALRLAALLRDPYSNITWSSGLTEAVPFSLLAGAAYNWQQPGLLFALDLEKNTYQDLRTRLGVEWRLLSDLLQLRLGFNQWNLAAGLGLKLNFSDFTGQLDYSFAVDPSADASTGSFQHRLSLVFSGAGGATLDNPQTSQGLP